MDLNSISGISLFRGLPVNVRERGFTRAVLIQYPQGLPGNGVILCRESPAIAQYEDSIGRRWNRGECGTGRSSRAVLIRLIVPAISIVAQIVNLITQVLDFRSERNFIAVVRIRGLLGIGVRRRRRVAISIAGVAIAWVPITQTKERIAEEKSCSNKATAERTAEGKASETIGAEETIVKAKAVAEESGMKTPGTAIEENPVLRGEVADPGALIAERGLKGWSVSKCRTSGRRRAKSRTRRDRASR